jgi:hypothetical protein
MVKNDALFCQLVEIGCFYITAMEAYITPAKIIGQYDDDIRPPGTLTIGITKRCKKK